MWTGFATQFATSFKEDGMAYEVILPKLGQTVEEGRIVEWLKAEGDAVDRGPGEASAPHHVSRR